MRDTATGQTVQLDKPEAGVTETDATPEPRYEDASTDGSRIFFTDSQRLTTNSTASPKAGARDLYVCEVVENEGHSECDLTDLSVDTTANQSAEVLGMLPGASEDGTSVYFVANGELASGASAGRCRQSGGQETATCNLYREHLSLEGTPHWEAPVLVDLVAQADRHDWTSGAGESYLDLGEVTSRVSPDGNYIAFMSDRSLTGYDNTDINSGAADEEVFLYNASTGKTSCTSCNPTGARPAGVFDTLESGEGIDLLVDRPELWQERWLSGSIPGWTSVRLSSALYQSRYLSDSGRMFFDSAEGLVPQDVNGKEDVYEYEPLGVGNCTESLSTFSASSAGCISLISSGTSIAGNGLPGRERQRQRRVLPDDCSASGSGQRHQLRHLRRERLRAAGHFRMHQAGAGPPVDIVQQPRSLPHRHPGAGRLRRAGDDGRVRERQPAAPAAGARLDGLGETAHQGTEAGRCSQAVQEGQEEEQARGVRKAGPQEIRSGIQKGGPQELRCPRES